MDKQEPEIEITIPDGLVDATDMARVGQRLAELLTNHHLNCREDIEDSIKHSEDLVTEVLNVCRNNDGDYETNPIEQVIVNLCLFIAFFICSAEGNEGEKFLELITETTRVAVEDGVLIPYFEEDSEVAVENEFDCSELPLPRRISVSMCFDSSTENEAIAVFFHSISNALHPENKDLIAKLEVIEEPLDGPYSAGLVKVKEFIDVNSSRELISELVEKAKETRRAA